MQNKIIVQKMLQYSEKISEYVKDLDPDQFRNNSLS